MAPRARGHAARAKMRPLPGSYDETHARGSRSTARHAASGVPAAGSFRQPHAASGGDDTSTRARSNSKMLAPAEALPATHRASAIAPRFARGRRRERTRRRPRRARGRGLGADRGWRLAVTCRELQAEARRLAVAASTLAGATAALGRLAANAEDARALLETEDEFFDGAGDASELRERLVVAADETEQARDATDKAKAARVDAARQAEISKYTNWGPKCEEFAAPTPISTTAALEALAAQHAESPILLAEDLR